jgi:MFS family permease
VKTQWGNWYFGWNIVAAAAVLTLLTVGLRLGIGPFFLPITHDLGFSRSLLSTIIAVGMLCYGIGMPISGYLVNARGTRFVLLLGLMLVVTSIIGAVMATGPWSFFVSFGLGLSLGLAFLSPVALTPIISRWFTRKRGMALFFLSTGSMAGIAILTPAMGFLIQTIGWRATLLAFAALLTLITLPVAVWLMRDQAPEATDTGVAAAPSAAGASPAGSVRAANDGMNVRRALKTRAFWQISMGLFACGYSMNLLGTHGVPMLMDHGFDMMTGSFGIGLIGFAAIFSTLVLGRLSDVVQRKNILSTIYLIRGLGFFALVSVGVKWELYTAATIGGIVWAGSVALSSAILADLYGVRLVGILYGWAYLGHQIAGMISSWLGGWAYETFHTHWIAFGSTGVLLLLAALVSFTLPKRELPVAHAPATP